MAEMIEQKIRINMVVSPLLTVGLRKPVQCVGFAWPRKAGSVFSVAAPFRVMG